MCGWLLMHTWKQADRLLSPLHVSNETRQDQGPQRWKSHLTLTRTTEQLPLRTWGSALVKNHQKPLNVENVPYHEPKLRSQ